VPIAVCWPAVPGSGYATTYDAERFVPRLIQTYDVERVLADVEADDGNRAIEILVCGVLLVFGAPRQLRSLAGQEHGRTVPLATVCRETLLQRNILFENCAPIVRLE
jgi:hypothetical protein